MSEWGPPSVHGPGGDDDWSHPEPQWSPTRVVARRRVLGIPIPVRPRGEPPATEVPQPPEVSDLDAPTREKVAAPGNASLMASSRTMAIASLTSRITGFIRSIAIVAAIGSTTGVANAYFSANTFPAMVYELLLGGVLSSVLVPLLVHAQEKDPDGGVSYTQRMLSIAAALLGVATLLAVIAAPWLAAAFAKPDSRELTSIFATMLLPQIFFYGLSAMFMAVLNTKHVYGPGAWAPVLNNVVMLLTIAVFFALPGPATLSPQTITNAQILVLGIGTTLGIASQALVMIPFLRATGFQWQWRFRSAAHEGGDLSETASLAGWLIGYVAISQIGVSVIMKVGSDHRGFPVFATADLLFMMPYGILVVSLLTALMPRLSRAAAKGDTAAIVSDLSLGARLSAVALVPITAGLFVLGPAFTTVFFAYGANSIEDARQFGINLAMCAFGLLPFAIVMLQLRVFYALRDGRTPCLINLGMVATKVVLVLLAAWTLEGDHVLEALNIATSASYVVGAVVGHMLLTRRFGRLGFSQVAQTIVRISVASLAGAAAALVIVLLSEAVLGEGKAGALAALVLGGGAGLAVMAVLAIRMRLPELKEIAGAARRG